MSESGEQVKSGLAGIKADVDEIAGDIDELNAKLLDIAGLPTVEEWDEIRAAVADLKTSSRSAADKVPETA